MFTIGCHLSSAKGYRQMAADAASIGANTFQFFTRNPRGGKAKAIDPADVAAFQELVAENGITRFLAHAPYTAEEGIAKIADALNQVLSPDQTTTLLLETMAGKGTEVGATFEELAAIIDRVELSDQVGVCLDTCHVWDGGYDVVEQLDDVLEDFDRVIGLDRLRAVHLNDSKNPLGAHKDRHEVIGGGHLGTEAFERIINHEALRDLPFFLETPHDTLPEWGDEIAMLKGLRAE